MTWFIHVANLMYLYSYTVKDLRKLRFVSILGILLCIPYYYALARYEAIVWSLIFLGINIYRLKSVGESNVSKG